jgi:hypothetical protein
MARLGAGAVVEQPGFAERVERRGVGGVQRVEARAGGGEVGRGVGRPAEARGADRAQEGERSEDQRRAGPEQEGAAPGQEPGGEGKGEEEARQPEGEGEQDLLADGELRGGGEEGIHGLCAPDTPPIWGGNMAAGNAFVRGASTRQVSAMSPPRSSGSVRS